MILVRSGIFTVLPIVFPIISASLGRTTGPDISKVITLIENFKKELEEQARVHQEEYDKYACWCEESLSTRAREISELKAAVEELQHRILGLRGALGSGGAELRRLAAAVAASARAAGEARAVRGGEAKEYAAKRIELEQYIGALEAAIHALGGASAGAHSLVTVQESQLLSAAASLENLLSDWRVLRSVSGKDLQTVRRFLEQPSRFVRAGSRQAAAGFLEARADLRANQADPLGDYHSQSGQVQGILKSMYGTFAMELERLNAGEGAKTKPFEELMSLKAGELASLESQVDKLNSEHGDKAQALAAAAAQLSASRKALGEAETFFADVAAGCREKAAAWAQRTTLRSQELEGVQKALDVLESPEARAIFSPDAHRMLLQQPVAAGRSAPPRPRSQNLAIRDRAYEQLAGLAARYGSLSLARLAAEVRLSQRGHFDKVLDLIDKLVAKLEQDSKDDEEKRRYCLSEEAKHEESSRDLEKLISKADRAIGIRQDQISQRGTEIAALDDKMNHTKLELAEISEARAAEKAEYEQGVMQDMFAIKAIRMAQAAISQFYRENGYTELQTHSLTRASSPAAATRPATIEHKPSAPPPHTNFDKDDASANAGNAQGIVQILDLIVENIEHDSRLAKTTEATSVRQFVLLRKQMLGLVEADQELRDAKHRDLAAQEAKQANLRADLQQAAIDKSSVEGIMAALAKQCASVLSGFESRVAKRQLEIRGLDQAKHVLMGAADHPHLNE